jgi:hypothetical protein
MIDTSTHKGGSPSKTMSKIKHPLSEEEVKRSHCTHGPNGKCINCLGVTKEMIKDIKAQCTHGPNEKCPNCIA